MEIPLVRGRFSTDFDSMPDAQAVAIVDDKFADRFWPGQDPLGKRVWTNPKRQLAMVGVVGSVKQYGLDVDPRSRRSVKPVHTVGPTVPVYMVIRHGLELTLAGIVLGLAGAGALTRVMASLLFGVGTLTGVSALLAPIALPACSVPASRAIRVDPVVALREE